MDIPDFSDIEFTAHKGVKKRPTTRRPKAEPKPPREPKVKAVEPEEPKPRRKPGRPSEGGPGRNPGKGAPRHAPRTGNHPVRRQQAETRQASHRWAKSGEWKPIFLEYLKDTGHATAAAELAGISRNTVYNHQDKDPEFKEACEAALDVCHGRLYASIMDQAVRGPKKYVFINGERKCVGRQPNALLAMFMMKKLDPSFRDSYDGGSGNAAVQMTQAVVNFLRFGDPRQPAADGPTFQEFIEQGGADMKILDVTPETPAAKVERLRAELAAAEAAVPRVPEGTTDCLT